MGAKKRSEIIIAAVLTVVGIALWFSARQIQTGAVMGQGGDFMPKLCSWLWLIISVLLLISAVMEEDDGVKEMGINIKGFLATLALLFVCVLLLKPVGFVLTSIGYMFLQMLLFVPAELRNKKNYIFFVIISVILPIAVNALFVNVFSLILPTGIL